MAKQTIDNGAVAGDGTGENLFDAFEKVNDNFDELYTNNTGVNTGDQILTGHVTSVGNAAVLGSFTMAQLNTAVSDANVAAAGANSDITSLTALSGNIAFTGTGNRITGDFSNGTVANRVMFQTSTVDSNTYLGCMPKGSGNSAWNYAFGASDPANSGYLATYSHSGLNTCGLYADKNGSGTYQSMLFWTGGAERMRIDTSGNVNIGAWTSALAPLGVKASNPANGVVAAVANTGTSALTGSKFVFNQNTVDNWTIGQPAGVNAFCFWNAFGTETNERMRIDSSGNVGIGVAPTSRLHVAGDANTGVDLTVQNGNAGSGAVARMLLIADAGYGTIGATSAAYADIAGAADSLLLNTANLSGGIQFAQAGVTQVKIDSTGQLILAAGQIKFPATQNASADANTLDDYEEGTWTPNFQGSGGSAGAAANTGSSGAYTKIGRMVTVFGTIIPVNLGSWTGNFTVTGLPFTSVSMSMGAAVPQYITLPTRDLTVRLGSGVTSITFVSPVTTTTVATLQISSMVNGCDISFNLTYYV